MFQNSDISRHQARRDEPEHLPERIIPRHYHQNDAERLGHQLRELLHEAVQIQRTVAQRAQLAAVEENMLRDPVPELACLEDAAKYRYAIEKETEISSEPRQRNQHEWHRKRETACVAPAQRRSRTGYSVRAAGAAETADCSPR